MNGSDRPSLSIVGHAPTPMQVATIWLAPDGQLSCQFVPGITPKQAATALTQLATSIIGAIQESTIAMPITPAAGGAAPPKPAA